MSNKNTKTMLLGTLTLILCSVIIGVFCFLPNNDVASNLQSYEILFDSSGGSLVAAITIDEGGQIQMPEEPTREGYVFDGWLLDGESFDFSSEITGNMTLTASWKEVKPDAKYYKVTFDTNGGEEFETQSVEEETTATDPGEPYKEGFEFVEWRLDGKAFNFDTPITKDITLVAYYKKSTVDPNLPKYVVSFDTNGGSGSCASQNVTEGGKAKAPSCKPTKKGYDFVGWNTSADANDANIGKVVINEETTFYAIYKVEVKKYTVSFNLSGGKGTCKSQSVEEGKNPSKQSCTPTKTGYKFIGWSESASSKSTVDIVKVKITANKTFYAVWEAKLSYTVTLYSYNGSDAYKTLTAYDEDTIKLPGDPGEKYHEGYLFAGWTTSIGDKKTVTSAVIRNDKSFYVAVKNYSLSLSKNSNSNAADNNDTYTLYVNGSKVTKLMLGDTPVCDNNATGRGRKCNAITKSAVTSGKDYVAYVNSKAYHASL